MSYIRSNSNIKTYIYHKLNLIKKTKQEKQDTGKLTKEDKTITQSQAVGNAYRKSDYSDPPEGKD
jgi:hypothetical protein